MVEVIVNWTFWSVGAIICVIGTFYGLLEALLWLHDKIAQNLGITKAILDAYKEIIKTKRDEAEPPAH